jgi:transketolase
VQSIDGQDPEAIIRAVERAWQIADRPHLIRCRTHIGYGAPEADTKAAHGGIPDQSVESTREKLGWDLAPFDVPAEASAYFRPAVARGAEARRAWLERRNRALKDPELAQLYRAMLERELPANLAAILPDFRGAAPMATRQASGKVLNAIADSIPALVGGSADLAGSNNTTLERGASIEPGKFDGRNIHFGVREHAMAAIANGLALHGGLRPYTGTFLVFSDYMRPSVRLAALMRQCVTFVFTHDSIFVGEDGPTHQPVEQLAALRAIPGLEVWRPADARETRVAWEAALRREEGPVALVLTRQGVPGLELESLEEGAARGGYVACQQRKGAPELVIVATGSEVAPAVEAASALDERRIRVVSVPCLERFLEQDAAYRDEVLSPDAPRLVVEAGVELGLAQLLRPGDRFHGMRGFGASAPWQDLAEHFGFTGSTLAGLARELLD